MKILTKLLINDLEIPTILTLYTPKIVQRIVATLIVLFTAGEAVIFITGLYSFPSL